MYHGTHNTTILADLNRDRLDDDSYCDVTLQVDGREFLTHRCILGKLSPFFNKMFKSKMKENYNSTINMEGVSSEAMETILDFIYTAAVDINEENCMELLKSSDYFQMDELKGLCAKFISESLNFENCMKHLLTAQTFDCALLSEKAAKIAASNFQAITQEDEFNQLSKMNLLNILQAVDQKKVDGKVLYEVSLSWVKHDCDVRKTSLVELLKCINFFLLPASLLQRILTDEPLVKESHDCKDYFIDLLLKRVSFEENVERDESSQKADTNEGDAEEVISLPSDSPQEIVLDQDAAANSNDIEEEGSSLNTLDVFPSLPRDCFRGRGDPRPRSRGHPPPPFRGHHHHPRRHGGRHRRSPQRFHEYYGRE